MINSVALLVLDAQDCFIDTLHDKTGFMSRCAFAIDAARALGIVTLFTEQAPNKLGHTNAKLLRRARAPKLFHKESFSALSSPGIEGYLRDNEIYHLLVCGLETPICVYQTGLQAVDQDTDVTFLVDALGCRRPEDATYAIEALRGLGCQILPTETVFYSLLGTVTDPSFRAFNNLVKTFSEPEFDIETYLDKAPEAEMPDRNERRRDEQAPGDDRPKRRRSRNPRRGRRRENPEHPATESQETTAPQAASNDTTEPSKEAAPVERKPKPPIKREKAQTATPRPAAEPSDEKASPAKKATKKVARKRAPRKTAKKVAKKTATPEESS